MNNFHLSSPIVKPRNLRNITKPIGVATDNSNFECEKVAKASIKLSASSRNLLNRSPFSESIPFSVTCVRTQIAPKLSLFFTTYKVRMVISPLAVVVLKQLVRYVNWRGQRCVSQPLIIPNLFLFEAESINIVHGSRYNFLALKYFICVFDLIFV